MVNCLNCGQIKVYIFMELDQINFGGREEGSFESGLSCSDWEKLGENTKIFLKSNENHVTIYLKRVTCLPQVFVLTLEF